MKLRKLFCKTIVCCLILTTGIFIQSGVTRAQEKPKLMPLELNGTRWAVDIVYVDQGGAQDTQQDTLIFEDGQFYSEGFKKKGYEPTNYSLTVTEDDATNFGTMQNMDEESAFWDGRVVGEVIGGSLHIVSDNGKNKNKKEYYFKGRLVSGVLERKDPTAKPKPVDLPLPAVQPQANAIVPDAPSLPEEESEFPAARAEEIDRGQVEQNGTRPPVPSVSIEPQTIQKKAVDEIQPKKKKKGWFRRKTE